MPIRMEGTTQITVTLLERRQVELEDGLHAQRLEGIQLSEP